MQRHTTQKRNEEKRLLEKLLDDGYGFLKFPKIFEHVFCQDYIERNVNIMRLALLIAVVLFFISSVFDVFFVLDWRSSVVIRFAIIVPIFIVIFGMMYTKFFSHYRELMMMLGTVIVAAGILCLALVQDNPMKDMYFNGLLLVLMFVFTLSRLRFWHAVICAVIILLMFNLSLVIDKTITFYFWTAHNYMYLAGSIILACANYLMENSMRKQFLQDRLLMLEKQNLLESNLKLGTLASTDPVTSVANRHFFEKHLEEEWRSAVRHGYSLGIMVIDFDLFKEYNDRYGHPAGDEVLKKLAAIFRDKVSRVNDLVARYGGDEFIILLEGNDINGVQNMAESIMSAVDHTQILHEGSTIANHVTLSIGCSAMLATLDHQPNELIESADKALYSAKEQGRHCIRTE